MSEVLIKSRKIDAINFLNLSFPQQHIRKNEKKKIARKYVIVCTLPETEDHIDSF